ncbi:MAG TPA: divalent-cation tolerance protein CutA [Candidatus Didemnitutus sp.]|nr:divalent-cation tolerance protein CutA [Candidatus Didemnitutus sp.]
MLVAWTTTSQRADAERLAQAAVTAGLAVCAQVEGPVISYYPWEGKIERTEEYRIMFKYLEPNVSELEAWIHAHHPYETPEWLAVRAESVGEKYLSWAKANSKSRPFPASKQP